MFPFSHFPSLTSHSCTLPPPLSLWSLLLFGLSRLCYTPFLSIVSSPTSREETPILPFFIGLIVNHHFIRMSPAVTMSAQVIHKPLSSSALSTPLAPSSPPPPLAASDTCVAGKKHTSTPPPPPIPARSSRRPVSAVLTSGRKLLKSTGADQSSIEISEKNLFTTPESTGRNVAEPHGSLLRPSATGETQARDRGDKPRPQRRQRRRRATTTIVEDIDREASNVCEIIEGKDSVDLNDCITMTRVS